jgi:hypothetical protein
MIIDVRRRRHDVDEEADVILAARGFELAPARQLLRERQRIDNPTPLRDRDHRPKDPAMPLRVEHRIVYGLRRTEHRVLIHEHGREHRLLGILGIRWTTIAIGITRR